MPLTLPLVQIFKPLKAFLDTEDPVWKAWRIMKEHKVKILPVKKNNRIVGCVSDRDIVQVSGYNGGQSMPVKDAMNLNPLVVKMNLTLEEVLFFMLEKEQAHAIVVDLENEVIGFFSWEIVFRYFLNNDKLNLSGIKLKKS